jgi:TRAP transporter TAXI family solute receptor
LHAAVFLVGVALVVVPRSNTAYALDLVIGTGASGTFSHFAGRTICRILSRHADGLTCQTATAPDDLQNLTNLQGGSLDLCLVDAGQLYDAVRKAGTYRFLDIGFESLRIIAPVYDRAVTLVVRKDARIASLNELPGKRINIGAPNTPSRAAVDAVWKSKGWTASDFSLVQELPGSQSQDTMAFCHGTIQAMIHVGVHPDAGLRQLFALCDSKVVDMNDEDIVRLAGDHPAFTTIRVPEGTYPEHPAGFDTFGTTVMLVVSADLDEQTVHDISQALHAQQKRLEGAHPAFSAFSLQTNDRLLRIGIEPHPGVVVFRGEAGIE